jgi:prepilin peptidase CpaA
MNFDARTFMPAAILAIFVMLAVWHDVRTRKIPNTVVLIGALSGLLLQLLLPLGAGLLREPYGLLGVWSGLAGLGLGLATLLPMYALGAMGAGDVKLMAMIGAFLGPYDIIGTALCSFIAGGVLALAAALLQRSLGKVIGNVRMILLGSVLGTVSAGGAAPATPTGKLPYAVAIAAGLLTYLLLTRLGGWQLWS